MLLYLTCIEDINLFDWVEKDNGIPIKKMIGLYSAKQFLLRDMRNLTHIKYIVLNLKAIKDTTIELVEAIQSFWTMYNARIIIFAEGEERGSELLSKLFDVCCYNIIISTKLADIKSDMERCLSPTGTSYETALSFKFAQNEKNNNDEVNDNYSFNRYGVTIGIYSPSSDCGSTHVTFSMAAFLGSLGAKVAVIEPDADDSFYQSLLPFYPTLRINNNHYSYGNCDFYLPTDSINAESYNFVLINVGTTNMLPETFDQIFVCSNANPWFISDLKVWLNNFNLPYTLLLNNVSIKHQSQVKELIKDSCTAIFFLSQISFIFDTMVNKEIYVKCLELFLCLK